MNDLFLHMPSIEYHYLNDNPLDILVVEDQPGTISNLLAQIFMKATLVGVNPDQIAEACDTVIISVQDQGADALQKLLMQGLQICRQLAILQIPPAAGLLDSISGSIDAFFPLKMQDFKRIGVFSGNEQPDEPKSAWVLYASPQYLASREIVGDRWTHEIEKWDQYYAGLTVYEEETEITRQFGLEILEKITSFLPADSSILEAGCGGGWQSMALARSGKFQVNLLDFSRDALNYARQVFARQNLTVNFHLDNIANPGKPDFDLVFNAGVFEHYTFEEQVELLKGMATRSKKYVLVIVPNRLCYWYWVWRMRGMTKGLWPFGKEVPVADLETLFKAAGLHFVGQAFLAASWTESFIHLVSGLDDEFREFLVQIHRLPVIDAYQKSYLVAGLGCIEEDGPDIPGWEPSPVTEEYNTTLLLSTIADMLSDKIFADYQFKESHYKRAIELERANHELGNRINEIEQKNSLLVQQEARLAQLEQELARTEKHRLNNEAELLQKNHEANQRENELEQRRSEASQYRAKSDTLQAELDEIKRARMWKFVQLAWQLKVNGLAASTRLKNFLRRRKPASPNNQGQAFPVLQSNQNTSQGRYADLAEVIKPGDHSSPGFLGHYQQKKAQYRQWLSDRSRIKADDLAAVSELIIKKDYRGIVVYPHAVHWEPVQRPQQILMEMGRRGYLCFFCEASEPQPHLVEVSENVYTISGEEHLLFPLQTLNVIVLCTWMYQMPFVEALPNSYLWYDLIDKIEIFSLYDDEMEKIHQKVVRIADLVTYSGLKLREFVSSRSDALYLANAARVDDFLHTKDLNTPAKMQAILAGGKPIVGYYGALAEWVDLHLFRQLAGQHPEWELVIIGKAWVDISAIQNVTNIHYLGAVPYMELPGYAAHFDVTIIPFLVNDLTDCVSPVKLFEYCALGLPVVATPFYEIKQYDEPFLRLAKNAAEFETAIQFFLGHPERQEISASAVDFALKNQWSTRVAAMEERMRASLNGLKALSNYLPADHAAVMTSTFYRYHGASFYAGGAERYLLDFSQLLASRGARMVVYQYGTFPWVRRYGDIDVVSLAIHENYMQTLTREALEKYNRNFFLSNAGRSMLAIYSAFYENWPLSLHPCIGISHGISWDNYLAAYRDGVRFWEDNRAVIESLNASDRVVSVDTNTANWFQTIDFEAAQRIQYVPNYVDLHQFFPRPMDPNPKEKTVILYPRRMYRARGLYLVLGILDHILAKYLQVEFHFVGRGDDEDTRHVEAAARKWGGRVKFYNCLPDEMPAVYRQADITLIPTLYSEGTSLSCLEALASGNAVIATRIGGLTNIIIDGYNGLLIEPNEISLEQAVQTLLDDQQLMTSLKSKGLEVSHAFTKEHWEKRWLQILAAYLPGGKTDAPIRRTPLVDIYFDDPDAARTFPLLSQLLQAGCLVYVRVKNLTHKRRETSFQRLQFLDWGEEIDTRPDCTVVDAESTPGRDGVYALTGDEAVDAGVILKRCGI